MFFPLIKAVGNPMDFPKLKHTETNSKIFSCSHANWNSEKYFFWTKLNERQKKNETD